MNLKMSRKEKKNLFADDEGDSSTSSSSSSAPANKKDKKPPSDDESEEEDTKLTINKKYARQYQNIKQREELRQLEQLDEDDDDSSEDEEEDEDGKLLTNSVNLQFLKTIKALKNKETTIYDPESRFFEDQDDESEENEGTQDTKRKQPKRFKDVLREQILDQMNEDDNIDSTGKEAKSKTSSVSKLAYDEQQQELRKAILEKTRADASDDSDEEEDWMVMKRKQAPTHDPKEKEIQEEFEALEKISTSKGSAKDFVDPRGEVQDGEQFLIDFIKKKKWIDRNEQALNGDNSDDEGSSLGDMDRADDFEAQYNFRFEQAAAETASSGASLSIQTYARGQSMNTVRRPDTTRKDKRQLRKERKEAERKAKEEQLKRLKNAKRQEMNQKLAQVRAVLGSVDESAVDEAAIMKMLDGDYDPEQFEKAMQDAYGDEFYEKDDTEWKTDLDVREALQEDEDGGVIVGQDDAEGGMYDNYDGEEEDEDADGEEWDEDNEEYVGGDDREETEVERKVKLKMQEELYKLDYEDIVAGMPTRFKYREVEANDYGVTTQEILMARDSTLKQFVSLKKLAPYNETGEYKVGSKKRRRFREMLKQDLEEEMGDDDKNETQETPVEAEDVAPSKKKRRRLKKGKKKEKEGSTETENQKSDNSKTEKAETMRDQEQKLQSPKKDHAKDVSTSALKSDTNSLENKKEKVASKKKRRKGKKGAVGGVPQSRLASYGL